MNNPLCSIIIRSFNEEKHIGRLLNGINRQETAFPVEVMLVDSGSTDATVAIARQFGIHVLSLSPDEFSFGKALNVGCSHARGEILVFASAHVYPLCTDWLENLILPFSDEKVALVYGRQTGNEVTRYSEHRVFEKWFPPESSYHQPHPFCNNANAAIRRSLWEQFPYDESLTGLEDLDWANKVINKNYRIAYEADAIVAHVHEETPRRIYNRYKREAIAMKHIMPKTHFSFFDFIRLSVSNILSDFYHAFHDHVLLKNIGNIITFRMMQFLGTYHGYLKRREVSKQLRERFYYPNKLQKKRSANVIQPKNKMIDYSMSPENTQVLDNAGAGKFR